MARLLWLADVARQAGLTVVEVPGWEQRGRSTMSDRPRVLIAHHTGTSARAPGEYPSLQIVRDGRPDLPGPLSHYGLGRSGTVYVIASGKANHAGVGKWGSVHLSTDTIGIEAEHPGDRTPWPAAQISAYERLSAAVLRYLGLPESCLCAHREWALPKGRKPDPTGIDMQGMRSRVGALMNTGDDEVMATLDELRTVVREEILAVLRSEGVSGVAHHTASALRSEGVSGGVAHIARLLEESAPADEPRPDNGGQG